MVDNKPIGQALALLQKLSPERQEEADTLPCPRIPDFREILINDTEQTVTEADLATANLQLNFINASWSHVKSITTLTKLIDATIKATVHRRNILKMSYGVENNRAKGNVFEPLD